MRGISTKKRNTQQPCRSVWSYPPRALPYTQIAEPSSSLETGSGASKVFSTPTPTLPELHPKEAAFMPTNLFTQAPGTALDSIHREKSKSLL